MTHLSAAALTLLLAIAPPVRAPHAAAAPAPPDSSRVAASAADATSSADPEMDDLVARINHDRSARGCPPLVWDTAIAREARRYSRDMAQRGFFDHVSPAGANLFDRLRLARIPFKSASENLAAGPRTGEQAYLTWANNPAHRRNLENCQYTRVGAGRSGGIWTLMLVRPKN